jgi:ABC-type phosphate/phosphonate transport system substrate-binding protein
MSELIAALPMYDWPECRAEVDTQWAAIRDGLRAAGHDAPDALTRGVAEVEIWRHPELLLAQTCWGPMERGLASHVQVVGQPSYEGIEGGKGEFYSSALVMRGEEGSVYAPAEARAMLPLDLLRGRRFAYNSEDSMSGIVALARDLDGQGESLAIFPQRIATGSHRRSVRFVAEGRADVAAIDCRSWSLFRRFEPDIAARLQVVGWTARRKGLPFITAKATPPVVVAALQQAVANAG